MTPDPRLTAFRRWTADLRGSSVQDAFVEYLVARALGAEPGGETLLTPEGVTVGVRTGTAGGGPADVCVFALQTCRDPERYDAFDPAQWQFRVVPGQVVAGWGEGAVAPSRLLGVAAVAVTGLRDAVRAAARR